MQIFGKKSRRRLSRAALVIVAVGSGLVAVAYVHDKLRTAGEIPIPVSSEYNRPPTVGPSLRLIVSRGEYFPNATLTRADGSHGQFSDFFDGTPTVFLFWHFGCDGCFDQAQLWNRTIAPVLTPDIKQVVVLGEKERTIPRVWQNLLKHKTLVFVNRQRLKETHHVFVMPTIVSVMGDGLVAHIQYEFTPYFDLEFVLLLTDVPLPQY
jgi:hypothetical protein